MSIVSRIALLSSFALFACGENNSDAMPGGEGDGDGSIPSSGGTLSTGGQTQGTGASVATGGANFGTGGDGNGLVTGGSGTGGGDQGTGGDGTGGSPSGGFVEDQGTDCVVGALGDPGSLPTIEKLPDPFTKLDGSPLTSKADWRCRRQEIKKQAEKYVFGEKPPKPEMVTGTVSATSITVNVTHMGNSTSFTVPIEAPSGGSAPYPALVSYGGGFFGFSQNSVVKGEGVAIVNYDPYVVGDEGGSRQNKQGAFYDIYGEESDTGLLVAWAWGVSRIIDVIEQSGGDVIKADRMAVAGCSRFGKGAIIAGAFDERMALTIPFESGTAGVPIWRGIPGEGAQTLSSAYGETYWFGDAFSAFTGSPTKIPIDTHEVLAMVAPRGLLVLDNPHIANLGPKSAHVAALGAAEVYEALGVGDRISYHSAVADGGHCAARPEHVQPLKDNIQKFLFGTGTAPGVITANANARGDLSSWRTWTTPTL